MPFVNRTRSYDRDADEALHHDLFLDLLQTQAQSPGAAARIAM